MGIRPTDLAVGIRRELDLDGDVFLVEPIGPISYVDVDIAGLAVKGICEPDEAPAPGEPRQPRLPPPAACICSTGRRAQRLVTPRLQETVSDA